MRERRNELFYVPVVISSALFHQKDRDANERVIHRLLITMKCIDSIEAALPQSERYANHDLVSKPVKRQDAMHCKCKR